VELQSSKATVEVVTLGTVPTLISDINGSVKRGDPITLSPFPGTGMKRVQTGRIIGVAQGDLGSAANITTQTVKTSGGGTKSTQIGLLPVALSSGSESSNFGNIPSWIRGLANGVAGHQVSDFRVIVAMIIFTAAFVWTIILIYSGVVGGILATGRNPLSGGWVLANIIILLIYIAVVMGVTTALAYTLLRV
jgi:hypothetical protein